MISGYPNKGTADEVYLGSLAQILVRYPRKTALRCADPHLGVSRETKQFMPTAPMVIDWCERMTAPLYREAADEARRARQFEERDPPRANQPHWIDYKTFLEQCAGSGANARPIGAFEKGGYLGPTGEVKL